MTEKPQVDFESVLRESGMPTTEEEIRDKFTDIAKSEGLITNTSRMSPFWRLITAIVTTPVIWLRDALINVVLTNTYVATAGGKMLHLLAWAVNLTPKPASAAQGFVRFYKSDIRAVVTVPAGTIIQTERINGVVYELAVTQSTQIGAGVGNGLVPVKSKGVGAGFNLAPGYYRILPVAVAGISSAETEDNWLTVPGADEEADDELRERCRNQFNLVGNYHTDAVYRSMIAGVAGLSVDRIFFVHNAPRGPGTANAYLLLDTGITSKPFIDAVNDYINKQGHHGHGDDMQCFAMPETRHKLTVQAFIRNPDSMTDEAKKILKTGIENLIRCAFRENGNFDVKKTWPYSRFSFSNLGKEIHRQFSVESVVFSLADIVSDLAVPRLDSLTVELRNG